MQARYFERPEGRLAYSDYGGSGDLVLMLPGMGALRSEYRYLAPVLKDAGYRPISADLRGHGESSVPWPAYDVPSVGGDILGLIEHLAAGPAHVIGTSFAAAPAVWAAARRPDQVRSLLLISPFVRNARVKPLLKAMFWLMMHNPWRVRAWGMYYGTLYPTRKPADFKRYIRALLANMAQPGRMDAADALANCSRQPSDDSLDRVQVPAKVIVGTKDPDFPDPLAEGKIVAERSHAALASVEGAGHYPQTEMPEKAAPLVLDFLEQTVARASGRPAPAGARN